MERATLNLKGSTRRSKDVVNQMALDHIVLMSINSSAEFIEECYFNGQL